MKPKVVTGKWSASEMAVIRDASLTNADVAAKLGRTIASVEHQRRGMNPPKKSPNERLNVNMGRNDGVIEYSGVSIRSVDKLLEACDVDLNEWFIERKEFGKWDVGRKDKQSELVWKHGVVDGFVKDSGKIHVQPLFRVRVTLKRKSPQETALKELLGKIESRGIESPKPKQRKQSQPSSRSLELCCMDLHIGCTHDTPEGNDKYNIEIAKQVQLDALDDLYTKSKKDGPFSEVFLPFGNDFVHVDNVFHTTTAGTGQPESADWHKIYVAAEETAIKTVLYALQMTEGPVHLYQIPGNHSRQTDFTLGRLLSAYFRSDDRVHIHCDSSTYKFHRFGINLIGYEHGHSIAGNKLASLMANNCPQEWATTAYREWHLGDQHRKATSNPSHFEELGVSVEYIPGLTGVNSWHKLKGYSGQKRGAMAFTWDELTGPVGRYTYFLQ